MTNSALKKDSVNRPFPRNFLWGTATAAYQIEGAASGAEDGRGPSIWDTFSRNPGSVWNGDTGDVACDQYHRLDEDFDLMVKLGATSYRFSVAWPRVQLDFYRRLVNGLRERDIEPMLTLYHWDLPQPLEDAGGWSERDTAERFADYVNIVVGALGGDVERWITINEPWCAAWLGYGSGRHAPGVRDIGRAAAASHHLLLAHGLALSTLRSQVPTAQVGITLNMAPRRPGSTHELDVTAARLADGNLNRLFLDPLFRGHYPTDMLEHYQGKKPGFSVVREGDLELIAQPLDFLGVNYYQSPTIVDETRVPEARDAGYNVTDLEKNPLDSDLRIVIVETPGRPQTEMDWEIDPSGLSELLQTIHDEYTELPIYITENGAAFYDYVDPEGKIRDGDRISYLQEHISATLDAIDAGVNVRGYYLWSLLDNFEWACGYSRRFGIVWVDFATGARLPKESFQWYADVVQSNSVDYVKPR
jgi:beta-glucosidase